MLQSNFDELEDRHEAAKREIAELRSQLADADRLLTRKNQEIQAMGGVLAAANQKLSDRDDEIQQLESKIQNLESKPVAEQQPAPPIDLSGKAWDVYSVVKPWLVPKAPKSLRSDIEKKLGGIEK